MSLDVLNKRLDGSMALCYFQQESQNIGENSNNDKINKLMNSKMIILN